MNIQQMRRIDAFVGGPICLFLEAYERVRKFVFGNRSDKKELQTILVTKYLGMGSVLLATPMLKALRAAYPESQIIVLTFAGNAKFTKQIDFIDEVISIRTASFILFAKDLFVVLVKNRLRNFDAVFDLEFFARFSTIVSYLSGATFRIGYYLPKLWRGQLLTHQIHFNPYKHVVEIFAAHLAPFNIPVIDFSLYQPRISEEKEREVSFLLKDLGVAKNCRYVVVNVNASQISVERKWPKENFMLLIQELIKSHGNLKIVLIGAKEDTGYVKEVHSMLHDSAGDRVVNLSGLIDIGGLVALLKQSSLFISNDSGPLHIASALNIPTISFFGPETPSMYGPLGKKDVVFYSGIYCSPCLNVYNAKRAMCNGNNVCMNAIKPGDVIKTIEKYGIL